MPLFDASILQSYLELFLLCTLLFFLCYWATELTLAGFSIAHAVYSLDFIETDLKFQKSLLLIMIRSHKPVRVTVGRFVHLSVEIFVWVSNHTIKNRLVINVLLDNANMLFDFYASSQNK